MMNMLKRLNEALPGLVLGIIIYGVLVQLIGMWFVQDKLYYSIGLWYGIGIAVAMAVHLAAVIYDSVTLYDPDHAKKASVVKSVTRYAVVVILFFIIGFFNFGSFIMTFIGVLGIKISAYAQPLLVKLLQKLFGKRFNPYIGDDPKLLAEYMAELEAEEKSTQDTLKSTG